MQSRQLLGKDAAGRGMATVAGRYLIKLYELANLSSCKGETSHRRSPERLPLRQGSPGEGSPEGVHVWLHLDENLADGDKATSFGGTSPFSVKAASTISSTLGDLQLDITLWNHKRVYEFSFPSPFPYLKKRRSG